MVWWLRSSPSSRETPITTSAKLSPPASRTRTDRTSATPGTSWAICPILPVEPAGRAVHQRIDVAQRQPRRRDQHQRCHGQRRHGIGAGDTRRTPAPGRSARRWCRRSRTRSATRWPAAPRFAPGCRFGTTPTSARRRRSAPRTAARRRTTPAARRHRRSAAASPPRSRSRSPPPPGSPPPTAPPGAGPCRGRTDVARRAAARRRPPRTARAARRRRRGRSAAASARMPRLDVASPTSSFVATRAERRQKRQKRRTARG